ncbi:PLDc N-terminal domain-containing protein [Mobiluncus mulieris]|nr:PLDc N-terminal domain-containing protein [Mobiluncus mulieris]
MTLVKSRIASKAKITWIVIVVFLPAVGSLLWLIYYTRTNHT